MRAKLTIEAIEKYDGGENITFRAVYNSANSPEDNTYAKYTPSATAHLQITNPNLIGQYKQGQQFYVDFTPVENK